VGESDCVPLPLLVGELDTVAVVDALPEPLIVWLADAVQVVVAVPLMVAVRLPVCDGVVDTLAAALPLALGD